MLSCSIQSVEHLLSALEAFGVDNARIEIEGGTEVPIVDGSALSWAIDLHKVRLRTCERIWGLMFLCMQPIE